MPLETVNEVAEKIRCMDVRGAGRIARCAAESLKDLASVSKEIDSEGYLSELRKAGEILIRSRPTKTMQRI
jgi:ribose 1,5-bisphosphate isomerase